MTTIAYDGKTLASDSLSRSESHTDSYDAKKIIDCGEFWVAAAGSVWAIELWIKWFKSEIREYPTIIANHNQEQHLDTVFVVSKDSFLCQEYEGEYLVGPLSYHIRACGSGAHFALGAMGAGASASRAVEIASEFDVFTNSRLQTVSREI